MEERFNAQMFVSYAAAQRSVAVEDFDVAPVTVISWGRSVIQSLADAADAGSSPHWFHNNRYLFFTGQVQGQRVSFAQAPIGAPGTVVMMEELIACGARLFLGLGWAGSLQPSAPVGAFLVPTTCVREEGTSLHYLDDGANIAPDGQLVERLRAACQAEGIEALAGPLWTTDAPYRELCSTIQAYARQGVLGVDMETSAMYALGQFRNVKVCNLLVVSDELWREWRPAFGTPELEAAMGRARQVILRCLESGLGL